jgi:hypothetical protein
MATAPNQVESQAAAGPGGMGWLYGLVALSLVLMLVGASGFLFLPPLFPVSLFLASTGWAILRLRPVVGTVAHRRRWIVLLMVLPWITAIVMGPMVLSDARAQGANLDRMLLVQQVLLAAAAALPLILIPFMKGGRAFTAMVGLLNLFLAFMVYAIGATIIHPGS